MSLDRYRTIGRQPQPNLVSTPVSVKCPCCGNPTKFIAYTRDLEDDQEGQQHQQQQQEKDFRVGDYMAVESKTGGPGALTLCNVPTASGSGAPCQRAICDDCVEQSLATTTRPLSLQAVGEPGAQGLSAPATTGQRRAPPAAPTAPSIAGAVALDAAFGTNPIGLLATEQQQQQPSQAATAAPPPTGASASASATATAPAGGEQLQTWREELASPKSGAGPKAGPHTWHENLEKAAGDIPLGSKGTEVGPTRFTGRPLQAFSPRSPPTATMAPAAATVSPSAPVMLGRERVSIVNPSESGGPLVFGRMHGRGRHSHPKVFWKQRQDENFGVLTVVGPDGKTHYMQIPVDNVQSFREEVGPQLKQTGTVGTVTYPDPNTVVQQTTTTTMGANGLPTQVTQRTQKTTRRTGGGAGGGLTSPMLTQRFGGTRFLPPKSAAPVKRTVVVKKDGGTTFSFLTLSLVFIAILLGVYLYKRQTTK